MTLHRHCGTTPRKTYLDGTRRASVRLLTSMRCSKRIAARSTPNSSTRSSRKLDRPRHDHAAQQGRTTVRWFASRRSPTASLGRLDTWNVSPLEEHGPELHIGVSPSLQYWTRRNIARLRSFLATVAEVSLPSASRRLRGRIRIRDAFAWLRGEKMPSQTAPYPDKRTYVGLVEAGLKKRAL